MSRKSPSNPPQPPAEAAVYDLSAADLDESAAELLREQAVRDVVAHAERLTRAVELATPMASWRVRPFVLGVVAALALAIAAFSWIARPAWVFGPEPGVVPPARAQAHARFVTYLVAQRITTHRRSRGAFPATLRETGDQWTGLAYRVIDSVTFELVDQSHGITFRSTFDPATFLGESAALLRGR